MPKSYPTPPETEQGRREEGGPVKKTFGVYDRPVRVSSPAMIAVVVIAALVVLVVVMLLMQR